MPDTVFSAFWIRSGVEQQLMTALIFVDTNVLIHAVDEANLKKQEAAKQWRSELLKSRRGPH
jgi:hypothetical protein